MCQGTRVNIGSGHGLLPAWHEAITWTICTVKTFESKLSVIRVKLKKNLSRNIVCKVCSGLNVWI